MLSAVVWSRQCRATVGASHDSAPMCVGGMHAHAQQALLWLPKRSGDELCVLAAANAAVVSVFVCGGARCAVLHWG